MADFPLMQFPSMTPLAPFAPTPVPMQPQAAVNPGAALLKQVQGLGGAGGAPAGGNAIDDGFIAKLMSGNPGGLIGALLNRQNAPVNPGPAAPAGSPVYVPGGEGPAVGGPATGSGIGMLARLFGGG